ncbi:MAG: hypothetical protein RLZZ385_1368 [Pseudomonadota bacterium]
MNDSTQLNRIFWQSRRGMLELDLLLVPFATRCYVTLNPQQKLLYESFLTHEDQDLYAWLMHKAPPADARYGELIDLILENSRRRD